MRFVSPGSTFKIVSTYAPALDSAGMTLADVEVDGPFNYDNGRPVSNWYSSGYRGICSLRDGIRDSLNIVTVKVLTQITPRLGYEYLQKFGFTTLVDGVEKNGKIFSDVPAGPRPWRYHIRCKKHRIKRLLCHHRKRRAVYQTQAVYDCKRSRRQRYFG